MIVPLPAASRLISRPSWCSTLTTWIRTRLGATFDSAMSMAAGWAAAAAGTGAVRWATGRQGIRRKNANTNRSCGGSTHPSILA